MPGSLCQALCPSQTSSELAAQELSGVSLWDPNWSCLLCGTTCSGPAFMIQGGCRDTWHYPSGGTVHLVLGSHVSVNSHQEADGALSSLPSSPSSQQGGQGSFNAPSSLAPHQSLPLLFLLERKESPEVPAELFGHSSQLLGNPWGQVELRTGGVHSILCGSSETPSCVETQGQQSCSCCLL